ncbi:hypothetical protein Bbelb_133390 [Branchiostoma belcheri]|nr:hypothetical protein Bbelb_133390 [Branchiostoma belcheri]
MARIKEKNPEDESSRRTICSHINAKAKTVRWHYKNPTKKSAGNMDGNGNDNKTGDSKVLLQQQHRQHEMVIMMELFSLLSRSGHGGRPEGGEIQDEERLMKVTISLAKADRDPRHPRKRKWWNLERRIRKLKRDIAAVTRSSTSQSTPTTDRRDRTKGQHPYYDE